MGAVALHELGDEDAARQIVVALVLAAAVRVMNDVERLHGLVIGTSHRFLDGDFALSVPAQLVEPVVVDAEVVGHLVEDRAADLVAQLVTVEAER